MANIKIRNLSPAGDTQITSGTYLASALNENEGTEEKITVRATAQQIVSGGAVYADFSEELLVSGVPVSTGSTTIGGKTVINEGDGGSIDLGDTNTNLNITSPSIFKESVTIDKTLNVTEAATFNGTSLFKGESTFEENTIFGTDSSDTSIFNSTSTFKENSSFQKDVSIDGNLTVGGSKALALDYSASNNNKVLKVIGGVLSWQDDLNPDTSNFVQNGANISTFNNDAGYITSASVPTSIDWSNVSNKPSTFNPSTHTHLWSDITNVPSEFTPSSHTHSWSDLTDVPTVSAADNGKVLKIDVGGSLIWATDDSGSSSVDWSSITNVPSEFAPSSHSHVWGDISNAPTTLAGYGITSVDWSSIANVPSEFTPSSHSHVWSDVTSTPTTLAGYGITDGGIDLLDANNNLCLGTSVGLNPDPGAALTGDENVIFGTDVGYNMLDCDNNILIGHRVMEEAINNCNHNVCIGSHSLRDTEEGSDMNICIGPNTLMNIGNNSDYNIVMGYAAMGAVHSVGGGTKPTVSANIAIGDYALNDNTASDNVAVGSGAGASNAAAVGNTYIGKNSGADNVNGADNTFVGHEASKDAKGGQNTSVGSNSNIGVGLTNCTALGYDATPIASNEITLGNSSITKIRCNVQTIDTLSDERIKKNIKDIDLGLDFINGLRGVSYNKINPADWPDEFLGARFKAVDAVDPVYYEEGEAPETHPSGMPKIKGKPGREPDERPADNDTLYRGFIAQEVKALMDAQGVTEWEGWSEDNKGLQSLGVGALVPILVKAVQELSAEVVKLKADSGE